MTCVPTEYTGKCDGQKEDFAALIEYYEPAEARRVLERLVQDYNSFEFEERGEWDETELTEKQTVFWASCCGGITSHMFDTGLPWIARMRRMWLEMRRALKAGEAGMIEVKQALATNRPLVVGKQGKALVFTCLYKIVAGR